MNIKKSFLFLFIVLNSSFSHCQIEIFSQHITLDSIVNSASDELNVVVSHDGQLIYFTRKNHPENIGGTNDKGDVWVSEKSPNGNWSPSYNLKAINSPKSNTIIGFMNVGGTMVLHDADGFKLSYQKKGQWSKLTSFEIPYFNSKSKELTACVSSDGRNILFGMESFGSYGVEDIYISRLNSNGKWTSPKNLGSTINTPNQEITPFLAADNKTLFFASNGHGGEGSFDIFMSTRLDDTWQNWSPVQNLGPKVNTKGREQSFTFLPEAEFAYLSSTQNSDGYGDLKKVKISPDITPVEIEVDTTRVTDIVEEKNIVALSGSVVDKKTERKIIGAEIFVTSEPTNQEYKTLTNSNGEFNLSITEGNSYVVKIRAYQYMSSESVLTDANLVSGEKSTYKLEPVVEGNTVTLDHVLFEQGKAVLIEGSQKELDLVVEMMKYNPDVSIFLAGHTDNQGKASLNVSLSEDRVQTVTQYLISHGVSKKRISGKGFGGTKPIASNASAETRKLNRRVEFTVHKIKKQKSTDQ